MSTDRSAGPAGTAPAACGGGRAGGFTLLELVIVLAVTAVLMLLAAPSFQTQLRQARRADGQTALVRLAMAQERLRASCPWYASRVDGTRGCPAGAPAAAALGLSDVSPEGHYLLSLQGAGPRGFRALATGLGTQAQDRSGGISCATLVLDQDGHRAPRECW